MSVQGHTLGACYSQLGFRSIPFSITPDTALAFPGDQYVRAYHQLHYACLNGTLAVLSAEVGLGKTLVIRCLIRALPAQVKVAYVLNPLLDREGLIQAIYCEFGGHKSPPAVPHAVLYQLLIQSILQASLEGHKHVIIVDEAHRLSADALELLRLLSNLETEHAKLIGLVLVGQPELERTLSLRGMRPLRERIGIWQRLQPMSRAECSAYVRHRIARTHIDGQFEFTEAALTGLHWRTSGVPRRINLAGERALFLACGEKTRRVTLGMVWSACNEFSKVWK